MKKLTEISPRGLLWLIMGAWWAVNLLQAAFTGLADDEAYYYLFSLEPAWGYFDHPPVTAWLVWLGTHIFGATDFGVRFFFTLLQPAYLIIFYHIIKPEKDTVRDVMMYGLITAALPILQLYGFLAVPDGPLLFSAALFLLCYKRFTERGGVWYAVLLGASVALMAYSKYHGALVVLFTLASNPRLLLNWRAWLSVAAAAVMLIPHLRWQADHDWASLGYHLAGRNKAFKFTYVTEYLLNIFAVFNPFFFPLYIKAFFPWKVRDLTEKAVKWTGAGLILFFLFSSIRGHVQPQWTIVSAFMFAWMLFNYVRLHKRTARYVRAAAWVTIGLVALLRIEMIFNPLGIKYQIFDNEASYGAIAEAAAGRPVIFRGSYARAAKYIYYTGGEAYGQPDLYYRTSQWGFMENDTEAAGREVIAEVWEGADDKLELANGKSFAYTVIPGFQPVRHIWIEPHTAMPQRVRPGDTIDIMARIANPYNYPVTLGDTVRLTAVWSRHTERWFSEQPIALETILPCHTLSKAAIRIEVPADLAPGDYRLGLTLRRDPVAYWYNSPVWNLKVEDE